MREKVKVLTVDDSKMLRVLNENLLKAENHEAKSADGGVSALKEYESFRPDVVLLDMTMPDMDGNETLRRILQLDEKAKVIMVTGLDDHEAMDKCMEAGAVGYISKPFSIEQFDSVITKISISNDKIPSEETT